MSFGLLLPQLPHTPNSTTTHDTMPSQQATHQNRFVSWWRIVKSLVS
jgi:hypothetical protein